MKNLYIIGGTMGVGKTAVSQQLKSDLPNSVFLDGDWLEECKRKFKRNIREVMDTIYSIDDMENGIMKEIFD